MEHNAQAADTRNLAQAKETDDDAQPVPNGEKACENGHEGTAFTETQCGEVGCCHFNDGQCWSAVGDGECSGYQHGEPLDDDDDDDDDLAIKMLLCSLSRNLFTTCAWAQTEGPASEFGPNAENFDFSPVGSNSTWSNLGDWAKKKDDGGMKNTLDAEDKLKVGTRVEANRADEYYEYYEYYHITVHSIAAGTIESVNSNHTYTILFDDHAHSTGADKTLSERTESAVEWDQIRLLPEWREYVGLAECSRRCIETQKCRFFSYNEAGGHTCLLLGNMEIPELSSQCSAVFSVLGSPSPDTHGEWWKPATVESEIFMQAFYIFPVSNQVESFYNGTYPLHTLKCECKHGYTLREDDRYSCEQSDQRMTNCTEATIAGPATLNFDILEINQLDFLGEIAIAFDDCVVFWDCNADGLQDVDEMECVIRQGKCYVNQGEWASPKRNTYVGSIPIH
jgi:hypothetical protein